MSLFYTNNLFESFLYSIGHAPSPLCSDCKTEEHTPYHIVMNCPAVDAEYRASARQILTNIYGDQEIIHEDTVSLLDGSRNIKFLEVCLNIINSVVIRDGIDLHNV